MSRGRMAVRDEPLVLRAHATRSSTAASEASMSTPASRERGSLIYLAPDQLPRLAPTSDISSTMIVVSRRLWQGIAFDYVRIYSKVLV